eukprot:647448-Alexandrium_andersonii.AAC.1
MAFLPIVKSTITHARCSKDKSEVWGDDACNRLVGQAVKVRAPLTVCHLWAQTPLRRADAL